ncbi:tetratricopeptide repeat protein [Luteimonas sp. MC1750]|uniref:tetratricopeptide repeat protein n=1 Tax=Luteimonas sp. MC1750 TaxID=2799326 RepID=UPI0018F06D52|nr:tetratricopeptide repeat protein [Luteimonas sp. MC1750]MBJ6985304.1 tetratricopeptide repeat protein [Luteimonas sp. MC1750]QQO05431.1 tetratricopeptide repeat protein [Luteimonas sp. MC1750]
MITAAAVLLIAVVYWPVRHGGFVWDDIINFVENDWLQAGSQWQHYILRDFNGWTNYFRPVGVGLFTIQVRLFDNQPGPMHLVSLGMHLFNTALVGTLAARVMGPLKALGRHARLAWLAGCMLFYGLHPVLIETVAWVGTQYDQLATGFMLLGACAALSLRRRFVRASMVGLCFFLAICSKESAASFPVLFLLLDWVVFAKSSRGTGMAALRRSFLRRNSAAIIAIVIASVGYLLFRNFGLGHLLQHVAVGGGDLSILGSLQKIAWTLFTYLRVLIYPWNGLNPIHSYDPSYFTSFRPTIALILAGLVALLFWATVAVYRRASAAACVVLVIASALLPVLNIVPTAFALSLYHERYAINALAFGTALLPLLSWPRPRVVSPRLTRMLLSAAAIVWLGSSILTIRATLPLWLDDERLWLWALEDNPTSELAQYNAVAALLRNGKLAKASAQIDRFAAGDEACTRCDLLVASIELNNGDIRRAAELVDRIRDAPETAVNLDVRGDYFLTAGRLALSQERNLAAVELLRSGIELHPGQLSAQVDLAKALFNTGQLDEAIAAATKAVDIADDANRPLIVAWRDSIEESLKNTQSQ